MTSPKLSRPRRRLLAAGAALLLLGAGAGAWRAIDWGLDTCGPLDRWLKRSGCVSTMTVDGFDPLLFETMLMSRETGALALFGQAQTPDGPKMAVARIDLATGLELSRHPLPIRSTASERIRVSADGRRAVLFCGLEPDCVDGGGAGLSIAPDVPDDPEVLAEADRYRAAPPGAPDFPEWASRRSVLMPGGDAVASFVHNAETIVLRRLSDGSELRRIGPEAPERVSNHVRQLVVSPSGRRIAAIARTASMMGAGAIVRVYDVASGNVVATLDLPSDRILSERGVVAFTRDEDAFVVTRRMFKPVRTRLDVFAIPAMSRTGE